MRNLSAFKIIGAIGAEQSAKGGALFHIIFGCGDIKLYETCIKKLFLEYAAGYVYNLSKS